MLGVIYTLLAAASFGFNNATVRRGTVTGSVVQVVALSIPIGLVLFVAVAAAAGQLDGMGALSPRFYALLGVAGIVHFLFGRYCNYRSIQAMGANLSAPIQQWNLMVSLIVAIVFLRESLDALKIFGIALMVATPALVFGSQRLKQRASAPPPRPLGAAVTLKPQPQFRPRLAEGYVFGILSCFCYGTSPTLVRAGLEGTGLALAGGVVSYGVATAAIVLMLALPPFRRDLAAADRGNLFWFAVTGVTVSISQVFYYLAMGLAPVTVVQPLMRLSALFVAIFSWFFNRKYEIFDLGLISAIVVSVVGALALTLDPGLVARELGGGTWITVLLAWKWPS